MVRTRILPWLAFLTLAAFAPAQTSSTGTNTDPAKPTAPAFDKTARDEVLADVTKIIENSAYVPGVDLKKWPELLAKQREMIDKTDTEAAFSRAVNRALRDLGISHVRLLAPRAAEARTRMAIIGPGFSARPDKDGLVVTMVFPKSAAETAGLVQGDRITMVDGKVPESADVLGGEEGTEIAVKFKHGDAAEKEIKLKRERFSTVRKETLTWKGDDTAILKIPSFSKGYDRENIETLMKQAAKAKYLVLDLRSNGGGATTSLLHLLSLLMPADTVVGTFISRNTAKAYEEAQQGEAKDPIAIAKWAPRKYKTYKAKVDPFAGKIAVLVNRGSASASEICTWGLKENLGAPVVGTKSAGAVLASLFRKISHGFEIQFPIQDYVTAKGVRLEANPITPDAEVTARAEGDTDPAVDKAIELLKAKALVSLLSAA